MIKKNKIELGHMEINGEFNKYGITDGVGEVIFIMKNDSEELRIIKYRDVFEIKFISNKISNTIIVKSDIIKIFDKERSDEYSIFIGDFLIRFKVNNSEIINKFKEVFEEYI